MKFNLNKLKKNKKGFFVGDFIFFGIIVLILAIIIVVAGNLTQDFNKEINESTIGSEGKEIIGNYSDRYNSVFDNILFFVFIMFGISIIASLYFLNSNPALFFIVIIVFAFILILIAIFSNVFDNFTETGEEYDQRKELPITDFLMDNYLMFVLVFGIAGLIILYGQIGRW